MSVSASPRKKLEEKLQPGDTVDCLICRGTGKHLMVREQNCPRCNGTGSGIIVQARCPVCKGAGTIEPTTPCHVCHSAGWICKIH